MIERFGYAATSAQGGLEEAVDFAVHNRFRWVELSLNLPEFFPEAMSPGMWARAGAQAGSRGIRLTAHAPEDISLIHLHEPVRRAGLERIKEIMDWCRRVEVERLTVHIGTSVYFTLPDQRQYLHQVYPHRFRQILHDSLCELRDYADNRVRLCIENVQYFGPLVVQEVLTQLLPQGGLCLTWDWGHSHGDPEQEAFMLAHRQYIRNCHVHDHNGRQDHLVVGDGRMDFPFYIQQVQDLDAPLIFEVRPREKAVAARDRFVAADWHLPGKSRKLSDNGE
jgi:sugar phosphate isomerase/epimerase